MAWTSLSFAYGSVLTSAKMTQLYDNLSALSESGAPNYATHKQIFTAGGTWTKPSNVGANSLIFVECWGGGAGGQSAGGGGGGGGAYCAKLFLASELGATETVSIGAGGGTSVAGGDTSFGTLVTAYGGGYGASSIGGGGGGTAGAGAAAGAGGTGYGIAGTDVGGAGGSSAVGGNSFWGGGGGGATGYAGGKSTHGGGGGGGSSGGAGLSLLGGDGGAAGAAGSTPGGGGGAAAAGARGECRVTVFL